MLCVPLLGRERGWSAAATGLVVGSWTVGTFAVTAVVARRGAPGAVVPLGRAAHGRGRTGVVALWDPVVVGVGAMALVGVGTALYTSTVLPLFVRASPADMLARFQALLGFAQNVADHGGAAGPGCRAATAGAEATLAVVALLLVATACVPWPQAATDSEPCPTPPNQPCQPCQSTPPAPPSPSSARAPSGSASGSRD